MEVQLKKIEANAISHSWGSKIKAQISFITSFHTFMNIRIREIATSQGLKIMPLQLNGILQTYLSA